MLEQKTVSHSTITTAAISVMVRQLCMQQLQLDPVPMHAVHGFNRSHYYVLEEERLDTVFQLNVKGTTPFDALIVTGIITTAADGTASKLQVYSFIVLNSLIQVTRTLRDCYPFALQTG